MVNIGFEQLHLTPASVNDLPLLSLWEYELLMQEYSDNLNYIDRILDDIRFARSNMEGDLPYSKLISIDGVVIGMLVTELTDSGLYLRDIYVTDIFRNMRIGTSIITKLINENDVVYLNVYKSNIRAISLYERLGFKIISDNDLVYRMEYRK